jgi:hypothetical protein
VYTTLAFNMAHREPINSLNLFTRVLSAYPRVAR